MTNNIYIPERFEKEIILHVMKIWFSNDIISPLMLSIDGPVGEGKTYQCKTVLQNLGVKVTEISPDKFESGTSGDPIEHIMKTYNNAKKNIQSGNYEVILIDDADVALGNWGEMFQYTVNTQLIISGLMDLADANVQNEVRVPIILTGNDLSRLYAPLRRTGRMNFFYWEPNKEEKTYMIGYIFPFLSYLECQELIEYIDQQCKKYNITPASISFYSSLKANMMDDDFWNHYLYVKNNIPDGLIINNINFLHSSPISLQQLKDIGLKNIQQIYFSKQNHIIE